MTITSYNKNGERVFRDFHDVIEILIDTDNKQLFISRVQDNKVLREMYDITDNFHNFKIK